jgi:hypothetical protein
MSSNPGGNVEGFIGSSSLEVHFVKVDIDDESRCSVRPTFNKGKFDGLTINKRVEEKMLIEP